MLQKENILFSGKAFKLTREQALRLINKDGIIIADNVLYKGYVLGDYNKHKQRTAVRNLREYISKITNDPNIETQILEVGDGIAISRII